MASRIVPQNLPQTEHSADPNTLPAFLLRRSNMATTPIALCDLVPGLRETNPTLYAGLSDLLASVRELVTEPTPHTRHTSETYRITESVTVATAATIRRGIRFHALLGRLDALGQGWVGDALCSVFHNPALGEGLAARLVRALEQAEPTRRTQLMGDLVLQGLLHQLTTHGLEAVIANLEHPDDDCAVAVSA